jgi:hypothetical protein
MPCEFCGIEGGARASPDDQGTGLYRACHHPVDKIVALSEAQRIGLACCAEQHQAPRALEHEPAAERG